MSELFLEYPIKEDPTKNLDELDELERKVLRALLEILEIEGEDFIKQNNLEQKESE